MANKQIIKKQKQERRKKRIRAKIFGTAQKPRLNVFRSLNHIYAQLIDDQKGFTVASVKDTEIKEKNLKKSDLAFKIGELIANKADKLGIKKVVFDKSFYRYHGRVKAVAEGARKSGLNF